MTQNNLLEMAVPDATPEKAPSRPLGKRCIEAAKYAGAITLSIAASSLVINGNPASGPGWGIGYFTDKDCEDPSFADRARVTRNIDLAGKISAAEILSMDFNEYADNQAEAVGLTLVDEEPYLKRLKHSKNVSSTTDIVADFMSEYDIEFEVLRKKHWHGLDTAVTVKKGDLKTRLYKDGAAKFIQNFHLMPEELVEEANVEDIEIVQDTGVEGSDGLYKSMSNSVDIEYDDFQSGRSSTSTHEMMHGIDRSICGFWGWQRDPSFKKLNPVDWHYGEDNFSDYSPNVFDSHSAKNVIEDKASIGEQFLTAINPSILNPKSMSPVIRRKVMLLLGRLERRVPGISYYISAINRQV